MDEEEKIIKEIIEFAIKHKTNNIDLIRMERLIRYYLYDHKGFSENHEQLFSWLRARENDDDFLRVAKRIVEIYGEDFLKETNIIEVGSGILPNLSERLIELIPGISKITVYDPSLIATEDDLKLHPNKMASKIVLKKEIFDPDIPLDPSKHTLIISRYPCGGTPAIIDAAGQHINIDLYIVLCDCDDIEMQRSMHYYFYDKREQQPNFASTEYNVRLFNGQREHNWQQAMIYRLQKKVGNQKEVQTEIIQQSSTGNNVIHTNSKEKKR